MHSEKDVSVSEYFSRMSRMSDIGDRGLQSLHSARVTIVGAGGVGASISYFLAQSGVGHLTLIDQDIVEPTNLHRLPELDLSSLYHPKAEAMAASLEARVPGLTIEPIVDTLRSVNADELLEGSDVVVDGLDNFRTRYLLNKYSVRTTTPYVFTSAIQNQGHVAVFQPPRTGCLECMFQGVTDGAQDGCEVLGVSSTITGVIAAIASEETLKLLLPYHATKGGELLTVDSNIPAFYQTKITQREDCRTCGSGKVPIPLENAEVAQVCGRRAYNVILSRLSLVDPEKVATLLSPEAILAVSPRVLVYRSGRITVSLFRTGRVLVQGVDSSKEALRVAEEAVGHAAPSISVIPSQ